MKAYKVFGPDWKCRGYQYQVGKAYTHDGKVSVCESGFHACLKLADCFSYYAFDPNNKVAEVECGGTVVTHDDDSKIACSEITIVREMTWEDVLRDCNQGNGNTGFGNAGNRNTGDWNTGDRNTGFFNSTTPDVVNVFDAPCEMSDFENADKPSFIFAVDLTMPVSSGDMTDEEKAEHPEHETLGGYIKRIEWRDAWAKAWGDADDGDRRKIENIPNFTWEKFTELTGIEKPEGWE